MQVGKKSSRENFGFCCGDAPCVTFEGGDNEDRVGHPAKSKVEAGEIQEVVTGESKSQEINESEVIREDLIWEQKPREKERNGFRKNLGLCFRGPCITFEEEYNEEKTRKLAQSKLQIGENQQDSVKSSVTNESHITGHASERKSPLSSEEDIIREEISLEQKSSKKEGHEEDYKKQENTLMKEKGTLIGSKNGLKENFGFCFGGPCITFEED